LITSLQTDDSSSVWHPFTPQLSDEKNVVIVRGEGACVYDESGREYIDAISSWWVNLHGHCHPFITERVKQQLNQLEHVLFSGYTHAPAIELAAKLKALLPYMSKVFYSDDGSTSVEVALKMAFQFWHNQSQPRKKIIAFENAYHGDTFGSMSVGARNVFSRAFESLLFEVVHIPVPVAGKEKQSIDALRKAIDADTAAFIFEPLVQGAAGMIMYSADVLNELIGICKEYNIITIADEVMTGFGRTGKMFATDYCANKPDIICLSKGITGGFMPLGATMCTERIYSAYVTADRTKTFFHGHSYTANPLACAAACANLEWFEKGNVMQSVNRIADFMADAVRELEKIETVVNARVCGTILAVELKTDENAGYLNSIGDKVAVFFQERGIILRPLGNVIYLIPPYCSTDDELSRMNAAMLEFAQTITRK
jgi:adenosylmethionine-8-amino-7-oxononanoate aminotransferase